MDNFLKYAVRTDNEAVILFWCGQRKFANPDELELIGDIYFAFKEAVNLRKPCASLLISELADERRRLKELAVSCLPNSFIKFEDDRLLDARAYEVFDLLVTQNIPIHPYLRPRKGSIYNLVTVYQDEPSILYAEALWEAGFRDVTATNWSDVVMPPLLFHSMNRNGTWCEFLISRGAKWTEQYPGGRTTAANVFGLAMGDYYARFFHYYGQHKSKFSSEKELFILRLFNEDCTDSCSCGCSRSGCVFITAWIKGATESFSRLNNPGEEIEYPRVLTYTLTLWAAPASRMSRWVASALIRSLTFWQLGIRHICCDIEQIWDQFWTDGTEPELRAIGLKYSPEVLQEIMEEDAFLVSRLEHLVAMFDAQYDSRGEDIVNFIMGYWSETMLSELEHLARTDHEQYGEGRRHLGFDSATRMDEGSNRSNLEASHIGEVNLDTLIYSPPGWSERRIRDVVPTVHTLDELDDIFHETEEGLTPPTPISQVSPQSTSIHLSPIVHLPPAPSTLAPTQQDCMPSHSPPPYL
jgi:hypothetical protein